MLAKIGLYTIRWNFHKFWISLNLIPITRMSISHIIQQNYLKMLTYLGVQQKK